MSDYFAPMAPSPGGALRLAGGDSSLWVKFERKAVKNAFKSELEGKPVYEQVDFVRIQQPGERDQVVRPVKEEDKIRFPKHWEAFLAKVDQVPEGTPVGLLFPNEAHVVEMLLDLKIQTVEQLAAVSEHALERLGMDGRKYVSKAQQALDKSEALKETGRLNLALQDAQDKILVLEDANDRMQERLRKLEARVHRDRSEADEAEERLPARRKSSAPTAFGPPPTGSPPAPTERPEIVG